MREHGPPPVSETAPPRLRPADNEPSSQSVTAPDDSQHGSCCLSYTPSSLEAVMEGGHFRVGAGRSVTFPETAVVP